ncbi:MAG: hypothetical protein ACP5NS_02500 [Candidatus Pacearchaeota archaeon]
MTTIISMRPVSLAEVQDIAGDLEARPELRDYLKQFSKLDKKQAHELTQKLKDMSNAKIRDESIVKVVDLLPRDSEAMSKIFNDVSLDEKETNEILELVKEY